MYGPTKPGLKFYNNNYSLFLLINFEQQILNNLKKIMKAIKKIVLFIAAGIFTINAVAQTTPDIVDIAVGSKDHTTLVAAVKAAGLVETLKGKGPFTVFAPTNAAFAKLPAGAVDNLLKPENKGTLAAVLAYHVVAGNIDAKGVLAAIKNGKGKAVLITVAGGKLTAAVEDGKVILTDEKGGKSTVTVTDLKASNGIIHVIETVLMPK
jgi:uncharacterized surface protein with fasciclin (FAS1) repeats